MKECSAFYIKRKLGSKQKFSYIISSYLPSLLVFIVFTLLTFITIFMHSMGNQTNELIEVLGSGSIIVYEEYDDGVSICDKVKSGQALGYGEDETLLLNLKGVESSYFNERRASLLKLEGGIESGRNIVLSKTQANELDVKLGDKIVLALYETEKERIRPILCTITGLYSSGYGEFDETLSYVPLDLLDSAIFTEILLEKGEDNTELFRSLIADGHYASRYQLLYQDLLDNVLLSIRLITIIVLLIALVAGFFALNIATEYTSRDKKDIKSLYLMGYSNKDIGAIYRTLSFLVTIISSLLGGAFGLALVYIASFILRSLDPVRYPVLANYVTSFSIQIPWLDLLLLYLALSIVAYTSLYFSLRQFGRGRKVLL